MSSSCFTHLHENKKFRRNREILFISYIKAYGKEINASTISRWIVYTVRFSYDLSGSSSAGKACAHGLRALLNFGMVKLYSLRHCWRSENFFIKFYLRDTAGLNEKISLGPIVVAQKVIGSRL